MATFDSALLTEPLSQEEPCGPDLEFADDAAFMNFVARAEMILPTSFFKRDDEGRSVPFDRSTIDFESEIGAACDLLGQTRDLRLFTVLAKLFVLDRDLPRFASCLEIMATLMTTRWGEVHPRGEDGDFSSRAVVVQTLDDLSTVVLPLQHVPLALSRRHGPISCRSHLLAIGRVKPSEGEDVLDGSAIAAALEEVALPDLIARRDEALRVHEALTRIQAAFREHAGTGESVTFDRLRPLAQTMLELLDGAVSRRDPGAARAGASVAAEPEPGAEPQGRGAAAGKLGSLEEAVAALAAAGDYFARKEPSSPAILLIRQAEKLVGKSFLEVIRILVPGHVEEASLRIGVEQRFELPIERLSGYLDEDDGAKEAPGRGEAPPVAPAESRAQAVALLEQVGLFFRAREPSSPIPLLTDRACGLAQRDFLGLLKDVLPSLDVRTSESD